MRPARQSDRAEIETFLRGRIQTSMFPLLNLLEHGWNSDAEYAMRFWVREEGGLVRDVLGLTNGGMVMPQCPTMDPADAPVALLGQRITGFIGLADQVRPIQAALGLAETPANLDRDEPLMALDLAELQVPDGPGGIIPLALAPPDVILDWMTTYEIEALQTPREEAAEDAKGSYARYCQRGSHVALMDKGRPLAMTGFNAQLPGIVQIGGVFTPPDLRSLGYARRALALHLQQARKEGVGRSVLFSASEAAQRTYAAIGYRQIGQWTLCLLKDELVIHG